MILNNIFFIDYYFFIINGELKDFILILRPASNFSLKNWPASYIRLPTPVEVCFFLLENKQKRQHAISIFVKVKQVKKKKLKSIN